MRRLGRAIALTGAVLAVTAPEAPAAATRAEYAAQVNPICAASTAQANQVTKNAIRKLKKSDKNSVKPLTQLFNRLTRIENATLAQLQLVSPAPGDEGLVATWLENRRQLIVANRRLSTLSAKLLILVLQPPKKLVANFKNLKRLGKKLDRALNSQKGLAAVDVDLGTQLGATACVTEARSIGGGKEAAIAATAAAAP